MKKLLPFIWMLFVLTGLEAQTMYNMSNLTVSDCEGFLLDSDEGEVEETYDHNENYTFTICIPGAESINLTFVSFCTEENYDFVRLFDGPDTMSTLIGSYSGIIPPPPATASSGCLTVNFISDPNVVCTGWLAAWDVEITEPEAPEILPITGVDCEDNTFTINLAEPIPCDSINAGAFQLNGPIDPTIISATPIACSGGLTSAIELNTSPGLNESGIYDLSYTLYFLDVCDSLWLLEANGSLEITNCPISVDIYPDLDPVCEGSCTYLYADVSGGDPNSYIYTWSPPLPNSDYVEVCPIVNTTYSLTVTDGAGSAPGTATYSLTVIPEPVISQGDMTICQSESSFILDASPPGGFFYGYGILDTTSAFYRPWLSVSNGVLEDTVTYISPEGCATQIYIDIIPISQGNQDAACPGTAPFFVSGGSPTGGTWSGPFIQADGLFDPSTPGSYLVTYTHPNGCTASKNVNVSDLSIMAPDTLCEQDGPTLITFDPFGGYWVGAGITSSYWGEFDPAEANPGDNQLIYYSEGCSDTINIFVKSIDVGGNLVACPDQAAFILPSPTPAGGLWSGLGIVDPIGGQYDPGLLTHGTNDTLTYEVDGCIARKIVYIRYTRIYLTDTLRFCPEDDVMILDWETVMRAPGGGTWTGPGTVNTSGNTWFFDPGLSGAGLHTLYYERGTCIDSMVLEVYPTPFITNVTTCEAANAFDLSVNPTGGIWAGVGITDDLAGTFDPAISGVGSFTVFNESNNGCLGSGTVTIEMLPAVSINGLELSYCYKDTNIVVSATPIGGTLLIDGIATNMFNPVLAGPGLHIAEYTIGTGECLQEETAYINVGDPVEAIMPFDTSSICFGQSISITADGIGGSSFGNYTYTWDQGLGFGKTHYVTPTGVTTYTVTIDDGCSEITTGSLTIDVEGEIQATVSIGPSVCYGETTSATVTPFPAGDYTIRWEDNPPHFGATYNASPGEYEVSITNNLSGCISYQDVTLPGYNFINADFEVYPNEEGCLSILEPEIQVIDLSVGGVSGYWEFGDSTRESYVLGRPVTHTYADTGTFTVSLFLKNDGPCFDQHSFTFCVESDVTLFAPNAFTPNYDGHNDYFTVKGAGVIEYEMMVFNRWGTKLFETNDMSLGWDGMHQGELVKAGVYTYIIKYSGIDNDPKVLKGFITVIR